MRENPGRCPPEARGKRVRVRLASGYTFEAPADGRGEPNWRVTRSPYDIVEWEIV